MLNYPRHAQSMLAMVGALTCAFTPAVIAQTQLAKLMATDAAAGNNFGNDVAIEGDRVVIGSPNSAPRTGTLGAGAAYIYSRSGGAWSVSSQVRLVASDRASGDQFGAAVALSGNWAAVGAPDEESAIGVLSSGSVYLYRWDGSQWGGGSLLGSRTQSQKIAGPALSNERFGCAVAMDGDTLVVGADQLFTASRFGRAFVYRLIGGTWILEDTLTAPDAAPNDVFGHDVAISGDTIVIGAPRIVGTPTPSDTGAAYVFTRAGSSWLFQAKLTPSDGGAGDLFGGSVALLGNVAVIGAEHHDLTSPLLLPNAGAAYVFTRTGSVWPQTQKLTASDAIFDEAYFGNAVGISPDMIAVGSYGDASNTGSVYLYAGGGPSWTEVAKVFGLDSRDTDQFSRDALALAADNTLIVGAALHEGSALPIGDNRGAAYIFDINGLGGTDSDSDGLSDLDEINIGTDPFNPDTDGDGLSDGLEVLNMQNGSCIHPLIFDTDDDGLSDGYEFNVGPNPCNPDVDGDGLLDGNEVSIGTDPNTFDTDGDGLSDGVEVAIGANPLHPDTDGDGLIDGLEIAFTTNPLNPDTDGDGLTDGQEVTLANGTGCPNPVMADSDGDGLSDGFEHGAGLNPCDADSDHDGLSDANEATFGTNPLNADTDGDGLLDGYEVAIAAGSGCPSPTNPDSDGDGLSDGDENTAGLSPCDTDSDNDGLSDANEAVFGTNPLDEDTDIDGLLDGTEVDIAQGTGCPNPLVADSDGDGLSDGAEIMLGTNPCNVDTDGDGMPDATDPAPLTPNPNPAAIASMTLAVADHVISLNVSEFLGPNNNARKGRRTALANNLQDAANAIAVGDYDAALASLMMVATKIDGQSPPPDWMPASPQRDALYTDVQTLITLVQMLQ